MAFAEMEAEQGDPAPVEVASDPVGCACSPPAVRPDRSAGGEVDSCYGVVLQEVQDCRRCRSGAYRIGRGGRAWSVHENHICPLVSQGWTASYDPGIPPYNDGPYHFVRAWETSNAARHQG